MSNESLFKRGVRSLQRTTASGRLIPEIEGLRFIAIASVFVFHISGYLIGKSPTHADSATNWLAYLAHTGRCGVHLFFMISGFVLALPWLGDGSPVKLRGYFLRRLTRLEPPYLLSLVLVTLAYYVTTRPPELDLVRHFAASSVYLHSAIYGQFNPANPVTWSLEVEIQFYILLPVLAFALFRARPAMRRAGLLALIVIGCCLSLAVNDGGRLSMTLLGFSQFFLAGILLADLRQDWHGLPRSLWWDLVGLTGFALVPVVDLRYAGVPLLCVLTLIFVSAFRGPVIGRVLSNPIIVIVGGMCYSIYLLHYPLISIVGRHSIHIGEALAYPIYCLLQVAIIGAVVALPIVAFFALIERPCMDRNWPRRLRLRMFKPSSNSEAGE